MMCEDDDCECVEHVDCDGRGFRERLTAWVLSQKSRGNLTPEQVTLFEQAIEDVEVGSW